VHVQDVILEVTKAESGDGSRFMWKPRPKGRKGRNLRVGREAATLVAQMVRERQLFPMDRLLSMPGKNGLPLRTDVWPTGLPISRSFFRECIWLRALAAAGVERNGRRFHDLRGTWITWALAGGADIKSVMDAAGHADVATTQRYMAAMADADERVLDAVAATKARYRKSS
jgi:integrase